MKKQYGFLLLEQIIGIMLGLILINISIEILTKQFNNQNILITKQNNALSIVELHKILELELQCKDHAKRTITTHNNKIKITCNNKIENKKEIYTKNYWPYKLQLKENEKNAKTLIQYIKSFTTDIKDQTLTVKAKVCFNSNTQCKNTTMTFSTA